MLLPILNASLSPDSSGYVAGPSETTQYGWTNPSGVCYAFLDGGTGLLRGRFVIPKTPTSSTLKAIWAANATANAVRWQFRYKVLPADGSTTSDVDLSTSADQTLATTASTPATAKAPSLVSISLTNANFVAGKIVQWDFGRLGADAADTLAQIALLLVLGYDDGN